MSRPKQNGGVRTQASRRKSRACAAEQVATGHRAARSKWRQDTGQRTVGTHILLRQQVATGHRTVGTHILLRQPPGPAICTK